MKKYHLISILVVVGWFGLFVSGAHAAPGDLVKYFPRLYYNTNGILFDGENLRISYFPAGPEQGVHSQIVTLDPQTGRKKSSICVHISKQKCGIFGIGGLAWDNTRKVIWAATTDFSFNDSGNYVWKVQRIDPGNGEIKQTCGEIDVMPMGDAYDLEYDVSTDSLWLDTRAVESKRLSIPDCKIIETVTVPGSVGMVSTAHDGASCYFRFYSDPSDPKSHSINDSMLAQTSRDGSCVFWSIGTDVPQEDSAYQPATRRSPPLVWVVGDGDDAIRAYEVPATSCRASRL